MEQIFTYYPTYAILDNIISLSTKNRVNIFVDLKNAAQSLYQEWAIKTLIEQSRGSTTVDVSIFEAFLSFVDFHKTYARKRNIDLKMIFNMEQGKSGYHIDLLPTYKSNRNVNFLNLDTTDLNIFETLKAKNFSVIDKAGNAIKDVTVISFKFLEADFIPYYIINNFWKDEQNCVNIIYSMDKDMLQCINKNTCQFFKHGQDKRIYDINNVSYRWFKDKRVDFLTAETIPMFLALVGDISDTIPKVLDRCGDVSAGKIMSEIFQKTNMTEIYENILKKESIFKKFDGTNSKELNILKNREDILIRNLKLTSFYLLSCHMNNPTYTDMIDKKNQVISLLNNTNKVTNPEIVMKSFEKLGMRNLINEGLIYQVFK